MGQEFLMGYCDVCQSAGSVNRFGFCEVCGTTHETTRADLVAESAEMALNRSAYEALATG